MLRSARPRSGLCQHAARFRDETLLLCKCAGEACVILRTERPKPRLHLQADIEAVNEGGEIFQRDLFAARECFQFLIRHLDVGDLGRRYRRSKILKISTCVTSKSGTRNVGM